MKIKKFLPILILIALIGAGFLIYQLKFKNIKENFLNQQGDLKEENGAGKQNDSQTASSGKEINFSRQEIMKDFSDSINEISPLKPVLGGKWFVQRFWFADSANFYVEYEDGHILSRILVGAGGTDKIEYEVKAVFEPGANDWILKSGKDTAFGKSLDLYEYDDTLKEWVKRN